MSDWRMGVADASSRKRPRGVGEELASGIPLHWNLSARQVVENVRAVLQQRLDELAAARGHGGVPECRAAVSVLLVNIRATLKQQLDHLRLPVVGGEHQRREAIQLLVVDHCAAVEQQVDDPFVAAVCGLRQRIAALFVLLVDLGATLQ